MSSQLSLDTYIDEDIIDSIFKNTNTQHQINNPVLFGSSTDEDPANDIELYNFDDEMSKINVQDRISKPKIFVPAYTSNYTNEELIERIRSNPAKAKFYTDIIVRQNTGLVFKLASQCTCWNPYEDRVQNGFEGLMKAISKYTPNNEHNTSFSTYAYICIKRRIYQHSNREVGLVELPDYVRNAKIAIHKFVQPFFLIHEREPSDLEISQGTNLEMGVIKLARTQLHFVDTHEKFDDDEDSTLLVLDNISTEALGYNLDETCNYTKIENVVDLLESELDELDFKLITLAFGLCGNEPHSYDEIIELRISDNRGKVISSKPTLSRRYSTALNNVKRIIERKNICLLQEQH